ncbi:MAG: HYR domain-containing protein [Saprospiraceae bacterium]|nr:HYR domain-containing protein [Saprospiraceae bacterium]
MKAFYLLLFSLLLLGTQSYAQYSETFSVPNKGILAGPCTTNAPTTCTNFDFAGVDWTLEGNLSGLTAADDNFFTVGGVLRAMDIDEEICWLSPVLNMTGTASFSMDLTWLAFDNYTSPPQSIGSQDYIDVSYRIDGGSWVTLPNAVGGGPRTISYATTPPTSNVDGSISGLGASGLTGSTLQIRVCVDVNAATELVTIDNVAAVNATTGMGGPVCDLNLVSISSTNEDCPGANDGSITVNATTSNGPITYTLSGPVNGSNQTGVFNNLPPGSYSVSLQDGSFAPGDCTESGMATIAAGVDTNPPTGQVSPITLNCPDDVPDPDPSVVTNVDDNCMIPCVTDPWINEFHYDNIGTDVNEFIEVAGPAGINLSVYTLYAYNGATGQFYNTFNLTGIVPNEDNGFGAAFVPAPNLQNMTSGIALVKNGTEVIEFISYEGVVTATNGPAMGMTSVDVGVSESTTTTPEDGSLGRIGNGNKPGDFTWAVLTQTQGNLNTGQTITDCPDNEPTVVHFSDSNNGGSGSSADPYIVTRTYRVTDAYGNFTDITQTLTANNCCTAPTATITNLSLNQPDYCPGEGIVLTITGSLNDATEWVVYTGGCGGTEITRSTSSVINLGSLAGFGTTTIYVRGEGACVENPGSCVSTDIIVAGRVTALCVAPFNIQLDAAGMATITAAQIDNGSTACTTPTLALDVSSFTCAEAGPNLVTLTVSDGALMSQCATTVTVNDVTPPSFTCPANQDVNLNATCELVVPDLITGLTGMDNCGTVSFMQSPTAGTAVASAHNGTVTVTITASDGNGNTSNCSMTLTGKDMTQPSFTCPANQEVNLNATCELVVPDLITDLTGTDNCGTVSFTQSPTAGTAVASAHNGTVTVTIIASDGNGNSSNCQVTLTGKDVTLPVITCPANIPVNTDPGQCSAVVVYTAPTGIDNCSGATTIRIAGPASGATFPLGMTTVTHVVTDLAGNSASCSFTVIVTDTEPPTIQCFNQTVTLNGETTIPLNAGSLVDTTDNCGVATIELFPTGISCEQVGQTVPVTVTVTDINDNPATCTSNITVTGLPCGWSQQPDGVNCADGNSIGYNTGTGVWTATSTNCFYGPGFTSDATAFAQRTLCGDGSITAQVTDISGTALGWAGVVMRETNVAGAKKAQLMTNLSALSRREFRTTTNGAANPQQFPSQNRYWLRLVRVGNQFSMYVSSNGAAWYFVGAQNIPMNVCIQMGLVATNYQQTSTVTATFANVSYTGSNVPPLGEATPAAWIESPHDFQAYPNPTSGELNVNLTQYLGRAVRVEVYSLTGQLLHFVEIEEVQTVIEQLDLSALQNGMYLVKVKTDGLPDATRRVVLTR